MIMTSGDSGKNESLHSLYLKVERHLTDLPAYKQREVKTWLDAAFERGVQYGKYEYVEAGRKARAQEGGV